MNKFNMNLMKQALFLAEVAASRDEVPVGALIIRNGMIIGKGFNSKEIDQNPIAHAEILAIRAAARRMDNYRLIDTTLYVTLEPCIMCSGTIMQARIRRLVFGASDPKSGGVISLYGLLNDKRLNHTVDVTGGVKREACAEILGRFFDEKRITSKTYSQS